MKKTTLAILAAILASYLLLHIAALPLNYLFSDEALYASYIVAIRETPLNILSPKLWEYQPPLFHMFSSFLFFFLEPLTAARLTSLLFGAISLVLTFLIGRRIGGNFAGFSAMLLLAFSLQHFIYSGYGLLDMPLTACLLLLVYSLLHYADSGNWKFFVFVLAFSLFVKSIAILFILFSLFYVLYLDFCKFRGATFRNAAAKHSILFLAFFSLLFIFFFYSHLFIYDTGACFGWDILWQAGSFSVNLVNLISLPLFPFFMAGVLVSLRRRSNTDTAILLALFVFLSLILLRKPLMRYLLPVLPLAMILVGSFIAEIKLPRFRHDLGMMSFFVILLAMPGALAIARELISPPQNFSDFGLVSDWIAGNVPPETTIYSYSDRELNFFLNIQGGNKKHYGVILFPPVRGDFERAIGSGNHAVLIVLDNYKTRFFRDSEEGWLYRLDAEEYLKRYGFEKRESFLTPGNYRFDIYSLKSPGKKPA